MNDFCCRVKNCFEDNAFMRLMRIVTGLALLPCSAAAIRTLVSVVSGLARGSPRILPASVVAIGGGIAAWAVFSLLFPRPTRLYVLAHELSHALWGAAFEGRVSEIRVSKTGGSVKLSKHNFAVALAPYFFPFYTIAVVLLYVALSMFMDVRSFHFAWLAAIGFTLGFHFSFTWDALSRRQPDVRKYGVVFSYCVIFFLCIMEITVLAAIVAPGVTMGAFTRLFASEMAETWGWCWSVLKDFSGFFKCSAMQ